MIPIALWVLEPEPFASAKRRADSIIESWMEGLRRDPQLLRAGEDAIGGWDGATLREGIIAAILEAEGWDVDALDDEIRYFWDHPHTRDAVAVWVERGPTLKEHP